MKFSSKIEKCSQSPLLVFQGEANAAEAGGAKIYHLNIGQPDILTPPAYYEAIRNFSEPVLKYCDSPGLPEFIHSVEGYFKRIGVELQDKDILATFGGSEAIQMLMAAILDEGDEIITPEPYYANYHTAITLTGAKIHPIRTCPQEGYRYAVRERVEECINEHSRAILITNPGNPTGAVLTKQELQLMLDIAKEHNLFLICDEVYREFTYEGEPLMSALQFPGYEDNVVVLDSVSKRFSACGARVGVLISKNRALMAHCLKWCQCRICVSTIDQAAAAKLYAVDPGYFDATREEYKRRRDTMVEKLSKIPGIVFKKPRGAFYVMAALPVDNAEKFQHWLLNDFRDNGETVMFTCGEDFYVTPGLGINEVRMAYVLKEEDIIRGLDILTKAIEEYNKL